MTLPRSVELRWQEEIFKLWSNTAGIPPDARTELIEMLRTVEKELEELQSDDHKH